MLRGLTLYTDTATIAHYLWNYDAMLGTDGSVKDDLGTYSFALAIKLRGTQYTLAAVAHGHLPDLAEHIAMDSHRPEGAALYAGLTWILSILHAHPRIGPAPLIQHPIRIVLDNKSVTEDAYSIMNDDVKYPWECGLSRSLDA
jgi:hypothetical protein